MSKRWQFQPKEKGYASSRQLYNKYRMRAREKGVIFELEFEYFREMTSQDCAYCGTKPTQVFKAFGRYNGNYTYNGVDRIDSTKGYSVDNCTPCCKTCNYMKKSLPQKDFIEHIGRILLYFTNDKAVENLRGNDSSKVRKARRRRRRSIPS